MTDQVKEKDRTIKEIETQLGHANQQLVMIEHVRTEFQRQFSEFDQQLCRIQKRQPIKLKWSEGKRTPAKIFRWSNAVVSGNTVYVKADGRRLIFRYDTDWSQLPSCPIGMCSIAVVNGFVTTIGGYEDNDYSNKLFSFQEIVEDVNDGRWIEKFPPMPTKRNQATSLCIEAALIVAGGNGEGGVSLRTVEVMTTETCQWSTAKDYSSHKLTLH